ncbi:hypothetical protein, partial [Klebsiella pneumoniae]|uniref:hypothetical protein n=1 Tax=Klebsiella pneumoniae TaxID=573 RepID=UPI001E5296CF
INEGDPFPGDYRNILESMGFTNTWDQMPKATIPGSPFHYRWNNPTSDVFDPVVHPDWADSLVICDVNNALDTTNPDTSTLDYLMRFVANQVVNGRGNEVILWSVWGDLNGGYVAPFQNQTFRQYLETLGAGYKYMAD